MLGAGETEPMVSPWHDMPIDLANDATLKSFLFGEGVHLLCWYDRMFDRVPGLEGYGKVTTILGWNIYRRLRHDKASYLF